MHRQQPTRPPIRGPLAGVLGVVMVLIAGCVPALAQTGGIASIRELDLPVAPGAREASLYATGDGRLLMSWSEPAGQGFAVKTAIRGAAGWSKPEIAVMSDNLFVNWADFPSIAALSDGTLALHWLMKNGGSAYDYDVNIALSGDLGRTWGEIIVPHRDTSRRQHGFVTLLPLARNRLMVLWLDGRSYDIDATGAAYDALTNAMQLRTTTIGRDARPDDDTLLDMRACTCCQTSAAVTGKGVVLVVYRDRSQAEIRDISLVRLVDGVWSRPVTLHRDGWEIDGCPINGPAIDTNGERAVVAWFTAAHDIPVVNVAFSDDAGESFGAAIPLDKGGAVGRVDVVMLDDGSALVTWLEWTDTAELLLVCRARPESGCANPRTVTANTTAGTINFPRMARARDGVFIVWTQPLPANPADPGLDDMTIRMVIATPADE